MARPLLFRPDMDRALDPAELRRARLRRALLVAVAAVAAVALWLGLVRWLRPAVSLAEVRIGEIRRGDLEETVQASGTAVPASERTIVSPVEARVVRRLEEPGAVLEPGQPILDLDVAATRQALADAEERLAQNRSDLALLDVEAERDVDALRAKVAALEMDLEIAGYRRDQQRRLHADGLTSDEELKLAEVAQRKAEIELARSRDEIDVEQRRRAARTERLELEARILRREIEELGRRLARADVRAESRGVLTWVFEEEGAAVGPGEPLARLADLDAFRIEAAVADVYAPRLAVGQRCRVLAGDESLPGRLERILPEVESGTVRFHVALDEPGHPALRPNLQTDVLVVTGERRGVLLAPRGPYVRGEAARQQVFAVRGDRAVRTDIELGGVGHDHYEIVSGLEEGDRVILSDLRSRLHAEELRLR